MILADSSAWIEFDRATGSRVHLRMRELIREIGSIAITEPIVMEVLAGARSDRREDELRRLLLRCTQLPFDPVSDFDGAVRISRRCRSVGIPPRGMIDCMIASVAWRRGATLLAHDVDLERVARVIGIGVDPASPRDP